MSSFCEPCPDKGTCIGPIESIDIVSCGVQGDISPDKTSVSFSFENGFAQGPTDMTVAYVDVAKGYSKSMTFHGDSESLALEETFKYMDQIERCTGPKERRRFFGLITKKACSAPEY